MLLYLLLHFVLALGALMVTQLMFGLVNHSLFMMGGWDEWLRVLLGNIHFGVAATGYFLAPFVLMFALPLRCRWSKGYVKAGRVLYLIGTGLMLASNLYDIPYFQFTLRRTTSEIFGYAAQNFNGGWGKLMVQFLTDYWCYFLLFFVLEGLLWWGTRHVPLRGPKDRYWVRQPWVTVLALGLNLVAMRGGLITQHKPLSVIDATRYVASCNIGLVVNTPFSVVRSIGHSAGLPDLNFFTEEELEMKYSPVHLPLASSEQQCVGVENVVLIILESFSEEYIGALNGEGRGWTPFLDSLVPHCRVYQGLANGKRSIESLPSLLSGIPSLMDEAFITSPFSQDVTLPLPALLKRHGYATAFFHGAYNGSMNFDSYTQSAGVDEYYGKDQYYAEKGDEKSGCNYAGFDGTWGIYDEPFLQFAVREMGRLHVPFFATIYTISSHHPFAIPTPYAGRFAKGELPILETVGYADYALSRFFAAARREPWFEKTLFVITADHAAMPMAERYTAGVGRFKVPMLFYWPKGEGDFAGRVDRTMQHADVYPTIVDLLGLKDTVLAFGASAERGRAGYHVCYTDGGYQLLREGRVTQLRVQDQRHPEQCQVAYYDGVGDPLLQHPVKEDSLFAADLVMLKGLLQQYSTRLKRNRLTCK